ncbi:hypothetical protein LTR10_010519 [Elasticomyces elasticus]|nr:hypothetical protein LTR10_010519 [Elasticomyces elasticus]KAK4972418.1 hypothetical protein LTR42_006927 [Elasticomyces elasticus]
MAEIAPLATRLSECMIDANSALSVLPTSDLVSGLPTEVHGYILGHLGVSDLLRVKRVNKKLRNHIINDIELLSRHIIQRERRRLYEASEIINISGNEDILPALIRFDGLYNLYRVYTSSAELKGIFRRNLDDFCSFYYRSNINFAKNNPGAVRRVFSKLKHPGVSNTRCYVYALFNVQRDVEEGRYTEALPQSERKLLDDRARSSFHHFVNPKLSKKDALKLINQIRTDRPFGKGPATARSRSERDSGFATSISCCVACFLVRRIASRELEDHPDSQLHRECRCTDLDVLAPLGSDLQYMMRRDVVDRVDNITAENEAPPSSIRKAALFEALYVWPAFAFEHW